MNILVSGSSGLIGSALLRSMSNEGHNIKGLRRFSSKNNEPFWDPKKGIIEMANFTDIDVVINLAGANLGERRWTKTQKQTILQSRLQSTHLLSDYVINLKNKPKLFISASAIGFYGDRGDDAVDENSEQGNGFLADVCRQWEKMTSPISRAGIRLVKIRLGLVLSSTGGALKKMIFPFKMGFGGSLGSGTQYMSWVSISDVVKMLKFIIDENSIEGAVNIVAPNPVINKQFTAILGTVLHRPTFFSLPAFFLHLVLGEMADELLLSSCKVVPQKLINAGYKFVHSDLEDTIRYLLNNKE